MPLIVETGMIVPEANSYATVAEADARHAMSTSADLWDAYDLPVKEQRLVTATRKLETMFDWKGSLVSDAQPLGFPRRYGNYTYLRTVPTAVKNATIDLALWLPEEVATSATSAATEDAIQEITLGPIGIKMATGATATTSATVRPAVPPDVVLMLRALGTYLAGGNGSVGRLVR